MNKFYYSKINEYTVEVSTAQGHVIGTLSKDYIYFDFWVSDSKCGAFDSSSLRELANKLDEINNTV